MVKKIVDRSYAYASLSCHSAGRSVVEERLS